MKPTATGEKAEHVVKVGEEIDEKRETPISIITNDIPTPPVISQQIEIEYKKQAWTGHYILSVLTTICCFGPCSVIGLAHFLSAKAEQGKGNIRDAMKRKRQATVWSWLAVILGLVAAILIGLFVVNSARNWYAEVEVRGTSLKEQILDEVDMKLEGQEAKFEKQISSGREETVTKESRRNKNKKQRNKYNGQKKGGRRFGRNRYESYTTTDRSYMMSTTSPFSRMYGNRGSSPSMVYYYLFHVPSFGGYIPTGYSSTTGGWDDAMTTPFPSSTWMPESTTWEPETQSTGFENDETSTISFTSSTSTTTPATEDFEEVTPDFEEEAFSSTTETTPTAGNIEGEFQINVDPLEEEIIEDLFTPELEEFTTTPEQTDVFEVETTPSDQEIMEEILLPEEVSTTASTTTDAAAEEFETATSPSTTTDATTEEFETATNPSITEEIVFSENGQETTSTSTSSTTSTWPTSTQETTSEFGTEPSQFETSTKFEETATDVFEGETTPFFEVTTPMFEGTTDETTTVAPTEATTSVKEPEFIENLSEQPVQPFGNVELIETTELETSTAAQLNTTTAAIAEEPKTTSTEKPAISLEGDVKVVLPPKAI